MCVFCICMLRTKMDAFNYCHQRCIIACWWITHFFGEIMWPIMVLSTHFISEIVSHAVGPLMVIFAGCLIGYWFAWLSRHIGVVGALCIVPTAVVCVGYECLLISYMGCIQRCPQHKEFYRGVCMKCERDMDNGNFVTPPNLNLSFT